MKIEEFKTFVMEEDRKNVFWSFFSNRFSLLIRFCEKGINEQI